MIAQSTYDTRHDWDLGTVQLKPELQTDYRQYPVGYFNGNEEISRIIRSTIKRLERRLKEGKERDCS